ncbi:response regulator transcription factor [Paenibacillus arenosi]|uniref:Response regulator transcription factor n=1 Tax=Paenibacillus arenosi TaxID=2774142 RepID=A0ABR9AYU3_9BACL|nr:response regulator transcription factor [Paenibacillus arenosi]MBD8499315.1 response regulator transcription factor [Paenibacillus arenosi]
MKKILLIEDEKNLSRFIELELQHESFSVGTASNGQDGLQLAMKEHWDLILLDRMLPGIDGLEVCRQIRAHSRTPIIMITAKDRIADRVEGLDSGADDYIPKPFAIEELLARIRVVFRRQEDHEETPYEQLVFKDLTINLDARIVKKGATEIELTKREYALLVALMENTNRVLSREMLLNKVWGYDAVVDMNVVDGYVRYLRKKIDTVGHDSYIQTLRGIGYVMRK